MLSQSIPSPSNKYRLSSLTQHGESGEATRLVAFRLLPVGLAFLLSFISISWLTSFRPAPNHQSMNSKILEEQISTELDQGSVTRTISNIQISQVFTREIQFWAKDIVHWSLEYSLDPNLIAVVMQIESCGHPKIQSSAGAMGLFQVMPFHFHEGENALDPTTNAQRGLSYLTRSLEISGGNPGLALAGYNGGHSVIHWNPGQWSAETSRYVYWGVGILEDIGEGLSESPRLLEWLANGGASLCRQAAEALEI